MGILLSSEASDEGSDSCSSSRADPERGLSSRSARAGLELLGNELGLAAASAERS